MQTMESWTEIKAKLKQKFAVLTSSDMLFIKGEKEKTLRRLQKKLGKTKEEIKKILREL